MPASARSSAACMPPTPPPTTIAVFSTGTLFGMRSSSRDAFATAILTASFAFSVASSGWCMCTHEFWSRMFAISNRKGFRPPAAVALRNVGSCRRGVQAATTTPVRFCSLMASAILFCPGVEHIYA